MSILSKIKTAGATLFANLEAAKAIVFDRHRPAQSEIIWAKASYGLGVNESRFVWVQKYNCPCGKCSREIRKVSDPAGLPVGLRFFIDGEGTADGESRIHEVVRDIAEKYLTTGELPWFVERAVAGLDDDRDLEHQKVLLKTAGLPPMQMPEDFDTNGVDEGYW